MIQLNTNYHKIIASLLLGILIVYLGYSLVSPLSAKTTHESDQTEAFSTDFDQQSDGEYQFPAASSYNGINHASIKDHVLEITNNAEVQPATIQWQNFVLTGGTEYTIHVEALGKSQAPMNAILHVNNQDYTLENIGGNGTAFVVSDKTVTLPESETAFPASIEIIAPKTEKEDHWSLKKLSVEKGNNKSESLLLKQHPTIVGNSNQKANASSDKVTVTVLSKAGSTTLDQYTLSAEKGKYLRVPWKSFPGYHGTDATVDGTKILSINQAEFTPHNDCTLIFNYTKIQGHVEVIYTAEGTNITSSKSLTGDVGDSYSVEPLSIPNYRYLGSSGNEHGTFKEQRQTVEFKYERRQSKPVTAHFQDDKGNKLTEDITKNGKMGESFEFKPKEIADYDFLEAVGNTSGSFSDREQEVTFVYKKIIIGTTVIHYVDVHGEVIPNVPDETISGPVGTKYTLEDILKHKKDIAGYTYKWVNDFEDPGSFGTFKEEGDDVSITYRKDQIPTLKIINVPSVDFGTQEVTADSGKLIPRSSTEAKDNTITVMDTLGPKSNDWNLVVFLQEEMQDSKNGRKIIGSPLVFVNDINDPEFGQQEIGVGPAKAVSVNGGKASDPDADGEELNQSYTWAEDEGIFFKSRNGMLIGDYEGTLDWTLTNAP